MLAAALEVEDEKGAEGAGGIAGVEEGAEGEADLCT